MAPRALPKPKPKKNTKASPAKKATAKGSARRKSTTSRKAGAAKAPAKKPAASRGRSTSPRAGRTGAGVQASAKSRTQPPAFVPRALVNIDDDDDLMAHGGGGGGFGRCGGRLLSSQLEQQLCNWLGMAGIVHSHSPRHYEVRFEENRVAAYAPQIVLRGRGREGKSVVIEAVEDAKSPILRKIVAFRSQYGQEFYVIVVATDDLLEELPLSAYDESCATTNVNTLIARLAE